MSKLPTLLTAIIGTMGAVVLLESSCNRYMNNKIVTNPGYKLSSSATGISGHTEYIKFSDGSQEVITYPSNFPWKVPEFRFYQDVNGDSLVDRIRINRTELRFHRLAKLLVREFDYNSNKKEFDEADDLLVELSSKHY